MPANLKKFDKKMQDIIKELQKRENMQDFAQFAADRIVKRTRLGKGVSDRGETPQILKPLKDSTKASRRRAKQQGKLSSQTSPSKSNLTFTGQMLASIKVIASNFGSAVIGASGGRKEGGTNKEVAGFVSDDRPFLDLSKPELTALNRFIRERIEKIVKKRS